MNKLSKAFHIGFQKEAQRNLEKFPEDIRPYIPKDYDPSFGDEYIHEPNDPVNILSGSASGGILGGVLGGLSAFPIEMAKPDLRVMKPLALAGGAAGAIGGGYVGSQPYKRKEQAEWDTIQNIYDAAREGQISDERADELSDKVFNSFITEEA